jgi:hypothetical protein
MIRRTVLLPELPEDLDEVDVDLDVDVDVDVGHVAFPQSA